MNHRHTLFVNAYIKSGGNATEAAIEAGYSKRSAYNQGQRMMRNDEILKEIRKAQRQASKDAAITVEEIVKKISLLSIKSRSENVKLKCYDLLMKHLGGYVNDLALLAKMDDEDVEKLAVKLAQKIN